MSHTNSSARTDRIALLAQQVSHYHAARYRAAREKFDEFRVYSWVNSADFDEFLADRYNGTDVARMYDGESEYLNAVRSGSLWHRVHAELDRFKPTAVVVAGWSFPESVAAISWARATGARVALMSASQPHDAVRVKWREAIKRRVVSACDAALVAAGPHGDYASHLGIPAERVFFGYDAVDNEYFEMESDRVRNQADTVRKHHDLPSRYLLASGRFIEKKNFPRLIEAFGRALAYVDQGHHLVILGDGPERAGIEAAIRREKLQGRVLLPGFRPYDSLPAYYGLADGFVHVALSEQWGLVVNEAAAAAQPLVISRPCGAASALVQQDVNGYLVEPENVFAITKAVAKLMALDDYTRKSMGLASRRIAGDWSPARFASGLRCAYDAALECAPRHLPLRDRFLFRALSHLQISHVR